MVVLKVIQSRRSIRSYDSRDVEEDKLLRVLESGRLSPSAGNRQERRFIVVPYFERSQKITPHTIVFCCHQKILNKTFESSLLQNRFQSKCSKKSHLI